MSFSAGEPGTAQKENSSDDKRHPVSTASIPVSSKRTLEHAPEITGLEYLLHSGSHHRLWSGGETDMMNEWMKRNTPRDYFRALTCGLSARERERRILTMLRAYVDESGSPGHNGIFVMGGLIAFNLEWEAFLEPWAVVLGEDTAVPFFRTASFRDPVWRATHGLGADAANSKTEALAGIITYPPMAFSVCCSVQKKDYRDIVVKSGAYKRAGKLGRLWLKTPYAYCFHNIIALTLEKIVNKLGIVGDAVDFVFDRNDPLFDAANAMLRELRKSTVPEWRTTLGDVIPANDETVLPLQAADLLAGRLRDYCTSPKDAGVYESLLSVSGKGDSNITSHIRPDQLHALVERIKRGPAWDGSLEA